ncbi:putative polyketide hydroxylase [Catenulispora sp. GAS73]|uniref:FAD-dependent monooxygenase n=1 Tax=Catenulispora sp. GAS73 TaxID=3156269 RepID=UPI003513A1B4
MSATPVASVNSANSATSAALNSSVLIVGAGLAGLSTAVFLGLHGIDTLVVERHSGLSTQPKARGQMPATMEALAVAGLAERFAAAEPPGRNEMKILIAESMTGRVYRDFAQTMPDFSRFSPQRAGMVSQQRAERILADRAVELGVRILFDTEVESFDQKSDEVVVRLRGTRDGTDSRAVTQYLIGADGHKGTIRDAAGIGAHGRQRETESSVMFASFRANLAAALDGAAVGLWHLHNAALPSGSVTVATTDEPDRFVIGGGFSVEDTEPDRLAEHIRTAAGDPGLRVSDVEIAWTRSGTWITRVADTFRSGRVLLIGDAAHLMPPTGGQGGNAAVLDGFHLAWKLAAVLSGDADDSLLDSHDAERRPYADMLTEQQYANFVQRVDPTLADESVAELVDPARGLFGYVYPSGAFLAEPGHTADSPFEDPESPTARPGTRAPHAVLPDGTSTRDLFGRDFVLLAAAGREGEWRAAAAGVRPAVTLIPVDDTVRKLYQLAEAGATLVRPDGVVAWRSTEPGELGSALRQILH